MTTIPTRRKNNTFLIGVFVLVGFLTLATAVIWLGVSQFFIEHTKYVTYFDGSVEGLERGSPVKYQGVPVGNVKAIGLAPDGKLIEVEFQIVSKTAINEKIRVKAELAGIAGGKFLQLFYPESDKLAAMHPRITFATPYPVIPSSPSGIEKLEIALTDIVSKIRAMELEKMSEESIAALRAVSAFFGDPKMQSIVSNFEQSSASANRMLATMEQARFLENINVASDNAVLASEQLQNTVVGLDQEVQNIRAVNIPQKIDGAFARYDSLVAQAGFLLNTLGFRIDNTMFSVGEAVGEFKSTNRQLQKTLRKLSDNPSQSIFSEPAPRER